MIKVGDYVRTKDYLDNQLICKIDKIIDEYCINTDKGYWDNEHILKSSPNIIDLIEVGDYVNGGMVDLIDFNKKLICIQNEEGYIPFKNLDIKSIVTKEQFESMEYKINE